MRVTKKQIVRGVADYIKNEILPKMDGNKALQIVASVAVSAAAENEKATDSLFKNEMLLALLDDDGSGTYEISGLMEAVRKAIEQYGSLPIQIPSIPFIAPSEIILRLNAHDIEAMRMMIEG